jgi:hypothetical protein
MLLYEMSGMSKMIPDQTNTATFFYCRTRRQRDKNPTVFPFISVTTDARFASIVQLYHIQELLQSWVWDFFTQFGRMNTYHIKNCEIKGRLCTLAEYRKWQCFFQ